MPQQRTRRDLLPVLEREQLGKLREGIRLRFVVVRVIGVGLVATRSGTQRGDAELLHHVPVIVLRGPGFRVDWRG